MSMVKIASVVATGTNDLNFLNIPQGYKHLQLRYFGRGLSNAAADFLFVRFNADFGTNYNSHRLNGDGASVTSVSVGNLSYMEIGITAGATATANVYGATIMDILDYTNTTKNKTVKTIGGYDNMGSSGNIRMCSGLWMSTAAVTQLYFTTGTSYSIAGSRVDLYGVLG